MKRILFFMLVLLFVVPAASTYSATVEGAWIWSENRYYDTTDEYVYGMCGDTNLDTHDYDVYMYVPSWTEEIRYSKLDIYNFNGPRASKLFTFADGYFPPGDDYTEINIYFFMDVDQDGILEISPFDSGSDPYIAKIYNEGTFTQLPLVQNVSTRYEGAQTIVSWDGITDPNFMSGGSDEYRVRVQDKDTSYYYYDSGRIDIKEGVQEYEWVINEDLFEVYGDNIWICIEAWDQTDQGLVNRSRYYASPSPFAQPVEGYLVTSDLWIKAVINTVEKGPIEAIWEKGGEDTTSRGDRVIWGHFYANPSDVTWGSEKNPDLFVKIWFDVSGRIDVNYFHVSVPDIEVYSDYPYDSTADGHGTTTMSQRYIRHEY